MLADASLTPLADMHVAVGAAEGGRTPVALVPKARMDGLAAAADGGLDRRSGRADALPAAAAGRRLRAPRAGRRSPTIAGMGAAFAIEPELAGALTGDAAIADVDEAAFEAGLAEALAAPALNLRQGAFARRRRMRVVEGSWRKLALYGLVLAALTLVIQIAAILSYTFAADRLENELAARGQSGAPARGAGFGPVASLLFEAIRSTPNAELTRLDWRRRRQPRRQPARRHAGDAGGACAPGPRRAGCRIEGGAAPNGNVADLVVRL